MIQASQIREHMRIVGSDGQQLGSVERLDGSSRIKLAAPGATSGGEQFIPLDWVASVEGQTLKLNKSSPEVHRELEQGGASRRR